MTPFSNNLEINDRVLDTVSGKQGKVKWTPRSPSQRKVAILYDGAAAHQYLDVMQLRLVLNGKPEEGPPVDGEPDPEVARAQPRGAEERAAIDVLTAERDRNSRRMGEIEAEFRKLKTANERLGRAIAIFSEA